jgi:hypothetical protein
MKRHEQDELLNELLSGEEVSDFREASLEDGLAAIRRRHWQRRAARVGVMLLLALLAVSGAFIYRRSEPRTRQMASIKPGAPAASPAKSEVAGLKVISDEELFALFPGRSMALVGKPGEQRLVFLDGGSVQANEQ